MDFWEESYGSKNAFFCIKELNNRVFLDGAQHATLKQNALILVHTCALPILVHNTLLRNTNPLVDQQITPKITGGSANLLQKYFVAQLDPVQPGLRREYLADGQSRSAFSLRF